MRTILNLLCIYWVGLMHRESLTQGILVYTELMSTVFQLQWGQNKVILLVGFWKAFSGSFTSRLWYLTFLADLFDVTVKTAWTWSACKKRVSSWLAATIFETFAKSACPQQNITLDEFYQQKYQNLRLIHALDYWKSRQLAFCTTKSG